MGYPTDDDFREAHGWNSNPPKLTIKSTKNYSKKKSKKVERVVLGIGSLVHNGLSYAIITSLKNSSWHEPYAGKKVRLVAEVYK